MSSPVPPSILSDRIRSGPTTLRSYGITDAMTADEVTARLQNVVFANLHNSLQDAVDAVPRASGVVAIPAGAGCVLSADLNLPAGVALISPGPGGGTISGDGTQRINVTGAPPSGFRGNVIENLTLDGVGVTYGPTSSDWGVGSTLRNCTIRNVTGYGVRYVYHSYLTLIENALIYDCSSGGVWFDFATAVADSGARMIIRDTAIHQVPVGVLIDGLTADGCSIVISGVDLEHTTDAGLRATGMADGVLQMSDMHFEANSNYSLDLTGGSTFLDGWDVFPYGSTHTAIFRVDAGRLYIARARVQWEPEKFCELFNDGMISIDSDTIFGLSGFFGKDVAKMVTAAGGQSGRIFNGGAGYNGRGGKVFAGLTGLTQAVGSGTWTFTEIEKFDASPRVVEFNVQVTIGLSVTNTLRIYLNGAGGSSQYVDLPFAVADGHGFVRIVYTPAGLFDVSAMYNGVNYWGSFTDAATHTDQRNITLQSVGATPSTINVTGLCESVR